MASAREGMSMSSVVKEHHEAIRDAVRRFAENEIAPISERLWQEEGFPHAAT